MRIPDLDKILSAMLQTYDGISDLNFSVGHPMQVEDFGELKPVYVDPPIEALTPYQTEQIALTLMQGNRRLIYDYLTGGSCDCSYSLGEEARFRVNIFRQQGHFSIVLRKLQGDIPTIQSLELPTIFKEIAKEKTGLVLVTGATGSGKTTTLAALLNEINEEQPVHIVTLEDPIEFVHPTKRATFNQRELGHDFNNYPNGLRAALRQAPKVILVGEMRDRATVEVALMAAETGHLVLSTLHTNDSPGAVTRLVDIGVQPFLVASSVRAIMAQRLVRRLCGNCKQLGELSETESRALNLEPGQLADAQVMKPVGCEECRQTGYKGRMGIFEIFVIDDNVRHMINNRRSTLMLRQRARELGMRTLREDGVRKVLAGMTSAEEVISITLGDVN